MNTTDLIRHARRPLPPHDLGLGFNFRLWAVAVCTAEVSHSKADFWRTVYDLRAAHLFDRDDGDGEHEKPFRLPHERYALAALNWLSSLLTHEADRTGPWRVFRWDVWDHDRRQEWWARWFTLHDGFVRNARRYQQTRREIDPQPMPAMIEMAIHYWLNEGTVQ